MTTLQRSELERLKVFEGVPHEAVAGALSRCAVLDLAPGHVVLSMGEPNTSMYMIVSGTLSVHLEGGPQSEPVAFLGMGQTVGELSLLDERPASAHVVVAQHARLLRVDTDTFWSLVDSSHDFAINLLLLLAQRLRANNDTVSTNIRLQREYRRTALNDALTGLYNRRWLDESLPRFIRRQAYHYDGLSLLVVDVDFFKKFNDSYGHPAGDAVLAAVAATLRQHVRPGDHCARFGGEEFVVVLHETDDAGTAVVAERLRHAVSEMTVLTTDGQTLPHVTISLGGAVLVRGDGRDAAQLLAAADQALYASKHGGRNRYTAAPLP